MYAPLQTPFGRLSLLMEFLCSRRPELCARTLVRLTWKAKDFHKSLCLSTTIHVLATKQLLESPPFSPMKHERTHNAATYRLISAVFLFRTEHFSLVFYYIWDAISLRTLPIKRLSVTLRLVFDLMDLCSASIFSLILAGLCEWWLQLNHIDTYGVSPPDNARQRQDNDKTNVEPVHFYDAFHCGSGNHKTDQVWKAS